ncbi:hypothetical protein D3C71_1542190 [compost metagenome]
MIPHHDGKNVARPDAVGLGASHQLFDSVVVDQRLAVAQVVDDQRGGDFLDRRHGIRIQGINEVVGFKGHTGGKGASAQRGHERDSGDGSAQRSDKCRHGKSTVNDFVAWNGARCVTGCDIPLSFRSPAHSTDALSLLLHRLEVSGKPRTQ